MPSPTEILKTIPLFSSLAGSGIENFSKICEVRPYKAGETIVREGDVGEEFFVIIDGFVNILRGKGGKESFMTVLSPGKYFGEASLFQEMKRTATARATVDVEVLVVNRAAFFKYIHAHPGPAVTLLHEMLKQAFSHLAHTSHELELLRQSELTQGSIDKLLGNLDFQ